MKSFKEYILETEKILSIDNYIVKISEADDEGADDAGDSGDDTGKEDDDKNGDKDADEQAKLERRGGIKFTIWEEPDKKVKWLKNNKKYQKIEYKHEDKTKKMFIDFLLGFDETHNTWKLWVGKIGGVTYDDDPLCDLKTEDFAKAIIAALDEVEDYIDKVEKDPSDWIQYYKDL